MRGFLYFTTAKQLITVMIFNIPKENAKTSGIYIIRNTINKKVYVGSAVNLYNRFHTHKKALKYNYHDNQRLQKFVNKYGIECLCFYLLEIVEKKENLIEREQYYFDTIKPFFNILKLAGSSLGYRHTDETKLKFKNREYRKGFKLSPEVIETLKNRIFTKEHREKLGKASAKRLASEETRKKIGASSKARNQGKNHPLYGKKHSDESKNKMSVAKKGKPIHVGRKLTEATKEKLRLANLGKKYSNDVKKRLSEIHKERWAKKKRSINQLTLF